MTPERKEEIHVEHELWAAGDRKHHPNGCPECELLAALDEAEETQKVLEGHIKHLDDDLAAGNEEVK